uniref:Uncharacterized protein n=1 Tax=Arundo donax TaxID=35708 RepID=A0A0A9NEF1_ARUDO
MLVPSLPAARSFGFSSCYAASTTILSVENTGASEPPDISTATSKPPDIMASIKIQFPMPI